MRRVSTLFFLAIFLIINLHSQTISSPEILNLGINNHKKPFNSSTISLKALEDDLAIEFKQSEADSLVFILRGYDSEWQKTHYPWLRYTRLKGGSYQLEYKYEKAGVSSEVKTLNIEIEKTWAEEKWFVPSLIFYGLLIIGAIIYYWTIYNLQQKIKIQSIRNRIAADLHDEVGSNLSSISISMRAVEKSMNVDKVEAQEILTDMSQTADEIILNLRDTVWMINPNNDDMERLFEKMRVFATKVMGYQKIKLDYNNSLKHNLKISMEQRYNAYMIFKEAINNIVKHAEATHVHVTIERIKQGAQLTIQDNGKGFDPSVSAEGNGLNNFKRRASESFFKLNVDSEVGKGTILKVIIPEL
jgi:signal transduction histidine kinase